MTERKTAHPVRNCTNHNGCVVEAIHAFSRVLVAILNETFL